MSEREQHEARADADPADPEVGRVNSGLPPEHPDTERPTDQAVSNQEQALESGEENVV